MRLFSYIDRALVAAESRREYTAREPRVWPSESSAVLFDQRKNLITGKCHRASFFRLTGRPLDRQVDAIGARKFRLGRACEDDIVGLCLDAGIHVASGVKCFSEDLCLPYELDLVVIDPETNQAYIVENKSYAGFFKASELKKGKPAVGNVVQDLLYLNEIKTGADLKRVVMAAVEKNQSQTDPARQARLKVTFENLEKILDGPLQAKLAYEDRAEGETFEFDVAIWEDPFDGLHYPEVDGQPWKIFTVESVYERYKILQSYWYKARWEAVQRLQQAGIYEPHPEADYRDRSKYEEQLGEAVRALPVSFWPPAEYEWKYDHDKILYLWGEGLISKSVYEAYMMVFQGRNRKPRPLPVVGDWQCRFCSYGISCAAQTHPEYASLAEDLVSLEEVA